MHVLLAGLKTMYSGVATPHQHQPTNVYLPPIRATNPGDASAQCRTAGSMTQSRTGAGHRAVRVAADAEYNLISSYHRENTSMPSSSLHLASGQRIWKRPHPRGGAPSPPPKKALSPKESRPSPNIWFLGSIRVHFPNGISISPAVFAQLLVLSCRQTDIRTTEHR